MSTSVSVHPFHFRKCVILLKGRKINQIGIATRKYWFYNCRRGYQRRIQKHAHASIQRDLKSKSKPYFTSKSHRNCCKSGLLVRIMYWPQQNLGLPRFNLLVKDESLKYAILASLSSSYDASRYLDHNRFQSSLPPC
jgi:hypothetical protein